MITTVLQISKTAPTHRTAKRPAFSKKDKELRIGRHRTYGVFGVEDDFGVVETWEDRYCQIFVIVDYTEDEQRTCHRQRFDVWFWDPRAQFWATGSSFFFGKDEPPWVGFTTGQAARQFVLDRIDGNWMSLATVHTYPEEA